jgi:DNA-binding NarL/FixJ family response regulator
VPGKVPAVTRIAVIDPQPAVRAGLSMLLRTEPGLVPVGVAAGAHDGVELAERLRPDVVLLEPHLLDGDGLGLCRRLRASTDAPSVILYATDPDPALGLLARVAGADGLVDKAADAAELFEAIRIVARGGSALPPVEAEELDAAAHRIEPEDLALLAMLVDRTPAADVADTLHLDRRRMGRRIERLLGRLRARPAAGATV